MKHSKFNEVYPYTYYLIRKSDGLKYVGARYANVKLNLTPEQDFAKVYFTSGRLKKDFKNNPENYEFRLCYTFDTIEEMYDWERRVTLKVYKRKDWANQGWSTNYGDNPGIGKLISEGKNRTIKDGRTTIEVGAEKLKDWVWNTKEGELWRKEISERKTRFWENISDDVRQEISRKRSEKMDFKAARKKPAVTLSKVGEDGLTGNQRNALKAKETRARNGTDSLIGKKRDARFKKILGEMSEEDFEKYCEGRSKRFIGICKTGRRKYLEDSQKYNELLLT